MAGDWVETTLGDVTDFLSGGTPSKDCDDYWGGSIPWVSAKDMKRFRLEDSEDHITEIGAESGTRIVPAGTVFLLVRGMTLLNDVPICIAGQAMAFNQDIKALRPKSNVCNQFLPYLLLGHKHRLLSSVDLAGHGTGRLNSDELKSLDILLPSKSEQRAIAHFLGTLDDKIELNRRMSETLEAMARALFKSWFVDFDPVRARMEGRDTGLPGHIADLFPSRLVDSELGEIPEGWESCTVADLCSGIFSGGTPSTQVDAYWNGNIPWLSSGETREAFIVDTERRITNEGVSNSSTRLASALSTVIASAGQGNTRGQTSLIGIDTFINQSVVALQADNQKISAYHLFFDLERRYDEFRRISDAHSSRGSLTTKLIAALGTKCPPKNISDCFDRLVEPMVQRLFALKKESSILAALRDELLPRLISGQLRINDVQKFLGRAL